WPFYVPSHSHLRGLVSQTNGIVLSAFFDPPAQLPLRPLRAPASCSKCTVWGNRDVGICGAPRSVRTRPVVRARNAGLGVGVKNAQANRAESARTILVKTAQATRRLD